MGHNYFTLAGNDSRDFGVYINGQGTFNAPARSYNFISVPGRNGDLIGGDERLENIRLTYHAFIVRDFDRNLADLRAFLLSLRGYQRLEDSYHPDEYRMACFQGPLDLNVVPTNDAGEFDLTFNCKPQRFLVSGEAPVRITADSSEPHTYTGSPAAFEAEEFDRITALTASITMSQSGTGDPTPENIRPVRGYTEAVFYSSSENVAGLFEIEQGAISSGADSSNRNYLRSKNYVFLKAGTYYADWDSALTGAQMMLIYYSSPSVSGWIGNFGWHSARGAHVVTEDCYVRLTFRKSGGTVVLGDISDLRIKLGEPPGAFKAADARSYSLSWADTEGTVYGGTLDALTGLLTVTHVGVDLGDLSWTAGASGEFMYSSGIADSVLRPSSNNTTADIRCSHLTPKGANQADSSSDGAAVGIVTNGNIRARFDNFPSTPADFKLAVKGWLLVYALAIPRTRSLSPLQISVLIGENLLWSDTGNLSVTVESPARLENPTSFLSQPLIFIPGTGSLGINDLTVTVTEAPVYIDCEMMDCYYGTANMNDKVSFSNYEFPVLKPGNNAFSFNGILGVQIVPRWWTV